MANLGIVGKALAGLGRGMAVVGEYGLREDLLRQRDRVLENYKLQNEKQLLDYKTGLATKVTNAAESKAAAFQSAVGKKFEEFKSQNDPKSNQPISDEAAAKQTVQWARANGIPENVLTPYVKVATPEEKVVGAGGALVRGKEELYTNPNDPIEIQAARITAQSSANKELEAVKSQLASQRDQEKFNQEQRQKQVDRRIQSLENEIKDRQERLKQLAPEKIRPSERLNAQMERDRLQAEIADREAQRRGLLGESPGSGNGFMRRGSSGSPKNDQGRSYTIRGTTFTDADIKATAEKYGMTVDEVKQQLGIQ